MVIICVRDQDHIQMGHVLRHDRLLNHDVHIEPLHQRVEHHRRATAVDEEARVAEPTDNCFVRRPECHRVKWLRERCLSLNFFRQRRSCWCRRGLSGNGRGAKRVDAASINTPAGLSTLREIIISYPLGKELRNC